MGHGLTCPLCLCRAAGNRGCLVRKEQRIWHAACREAPRPTHTQRVCRALSRGPQGMAVSQWTPRPLGHTAPKPGLQQLRPSCHWGDPVQAMNLLPHEGTEIKRTFTACLSGFYLIYQPVSVSRLCKNSNPKEAYLLCICAHLRNITRRTPRQLMWSVGRMSF